MVKQARPAVVRIYSSSSTGSGAIFETQGQTGYVITNHHVVEGVTEVNVTVNDLATYRGTVLGTDHDRDLAVVRICCGRFHTLPFGDASRLEPGDEIVAIGYALGLSGEATITRGIVSAIRYDSDYRSDVIQTDAAINPGNSGGPMLSMSGEILGINTFRIDESDSGRSAQGLGFAVSGTTVQELIPTLRAGAPRLTPTPTPAPTPVSGGSDGFGPIDGQLWHEPTDGFIEAEYANISFADGLVWATFVNPYSAATQSWDYGFIFRQDQHDPDDPFIQVIVSSNGRWAVKAGANTPYQGIGEGTLGTFDTTAGVRNLVSVAVLGKRGLLFVNGEFVSMLDLSMVTGAGDVAVITGAVEGTERVGAATQFEEFTIAPLTKRYGPASGTLEKEPGFIAQQDSGVWARDVIVEAEYNSPLGTDWDYGFVIRNPEFNRLEVIGISGDGQWFHDTRDIGDSEYTEMASGSLGDSGARILNRNHLLVMALENVGLLFVNGEYVARLDLSHNQDHGDVSVMGGFYSSHRGSPEFENFNVWAP